MLHAGQSKNERGEGDFASISLSRCASDGIPTSPNR
ncbi:hypothetical protein JJ691_30100 [Kutzneria sp. CA-103260]|nr:hypothetical protein JJ691_30100 [Kutzneria sp. CA-103260]